MLLEEALGWRTAHIPSNQFLVIKDSVSSPGSFLLHYLLKRILVTSSSDLATRPLVIFVALKEPFSHYSRILKKQGCNLQAHKDSGALVFIDLLSDGMPASEQMPSQANKLFPLFLYFLKLLARKERQNAWIIIDDISLLEVTTEGNKAHVTDFIHYCRTLGSSKQACSLVLLMHGDVYRSVDEMSIVHQLELWADIEINVEPFATGQANDVHGQLTVEHQMQRSYLNCYGLHYKVLFLRTTKEFLIYMPGCNRKTISKLIGKPFFVP